MKLPSLYAIADAGALARHGVPLRRFAEELAAAGVTLLQYRDKLASPQTILRHCELLSDVFAGTGATLILNDRADLAALAGWGVHVGQGDLAAADARTVVGPGCTIGVSTHTDAEVSLANGGPSDYVATGPVFSTGTKLDAEPPVGLAGVQRARALTPKPLVAIGGITLANGRSVLDAGADSLAVISGLLVPGRAIVETARDFLALRRA